MADMVARLSACGFRHVRPPNEGDGAAVAFDPNGGWNGNVFSFAPQLAGGFQL